MMTEDAGYWLLATILYCLFIVYLLWMFFVFLLYIDMDEAILLIIAVVLLIYYLYRWNCGCSEGLDIRSRASIYLKQIAAMRQLNTL